MRCVLACTEIWMYMCVFWVGVCNKIADSWFVPLAFKNMRRNIKSDTQNQYKEVS